jgi:hypothetical protein
MKCCFDPVRYGILWVALSGSIRRRKKAMHIKLFGKGPHFKKAAAFLKYVGPGLLVTVGFIDPGNWASNIAAGSRFGYTLLWMVTLSTAMLIVLQHNAAHLGIVTGKCLSEAETARIPHGYATSCSSPRSARRSPRCLR